MILARPRVNCALALLLALAVACARAMILRPHLERRCGHADSSNVASSLADIGRRYGSDRMTNPDFKSWPSHHYEILYEKYLQPYRSRVFKMLEIGLGCGMPEGVGLGIPMWRDYLPCVQLYYLEYDAPCAARFASQVEGIVAGDQANLTDLSRVQALGPFDVVIDDGGHSMNQQITSIVHLFPRLPPGGLYFVEDLRSSIVQYRDTQDRPMGDTTHMFLFRLLAALHVRNLVLQKTAVDLRDAEVLAVLPYVLSIDCQTELCTLVRNDQPAFTGAMRQPTLDVPV